jgi:hypothetical protein
MTAIPPRGPQAAGTAVARASRPPAGTLASATGRTAHYQVRDERGLDSRRATWPDNRQVTGDGAQTAISACQPIPGRAVRHPHRCGGSTPAPAWPPARGRPIPAPPAPATKHGLDRRHAPRAGTAHAPASEVTMMSFTEPGTQALGAIADGLAGSDPRLASMLTIFSRLACPAHYTTCIESCCAGEEHW